MPEFLWASLKPCISSQIALCTHVGAGSSFACASVKPCTSSQIVLSTHFGAGSGFASAKLKPCTWSQIVLSTHFGSGPGFACAILSHCLYGCTRFCMLNSRCRHIFATVQKLSLRCFSLSIGFRTLLHAEIMLSTQFRAVSRFTRAILSLSTGYGAILHVEFVCHTFSRRFQFYPCDSIALSIKFRAILHAEVELSTRRNGSGFTRAILYSLPLRGSLPLSNGFRTQLHAEIMLSTFFASVQHLPVRFFTDQCTFDKYSFQLVESKARTFHGRVGAGRRTAGRRGGAETGRTVRRQVGSPRTQPSLVPFGPS